jgi:hypothetical protein
MGAWLEALLMVPVEVEVLTAERESEEVVVKRLVEVGAGILKVRTSCWSDYSVVDWVDWGWLRRCS